MPGKSKRAPAEGGRATRRPCPKLLSSGAAGSSTSAGAAIILILIIVAAGVYFAAHGGLQPYASPGISSVHYSNTVATSNGSAPSSTTSGNVSSNVVSVSSNLPAVIVRLSILPGAAADSKTPGYSPGNVTVVIGVNNTVKWTNDDSAVHTVTAKDASFDSGNLNPGQSYAHTFTTAGTYTYVCKFHSWMHGTIIVRLK